MSKWRVELYEGGNVLQM